jgi:hypothetical protein
LPLSSISDEGNERIFLFIVLYEKELLSLSFPYKTSASSCEASGKQIKNNKSLIKGF